MNELPRWSAPIVGGIIGAFLGLRASRDIEGPLFYAVAGGAFIGAMAGCLIFLLDSGKEKTKPNKSDSPFATPQKFGTPQASLAPQSSGIIPKFLAVCSVALFFAPVVGLLLGVAAVVANRSSQDWPNIVSKIGLGLGALVTALFFLALVLG